MSGLMEKDFDKFGKVLDFSTTYIRDGQENLLCIHKDKDTGKVEITRVELEEETKEKK